MKNRRKAKRAWFPCWLGLCLYALGAQAQNKTWNAATGDWANGANWTPLGVPGASNNFPLSAGLLPRRCSEPKIRGETQLVGSGLCARFDPMGLISITGKAL
jgi:hypothetical protein